ncbi:MAG: protein-disulfide reductase DsbD domain-containing protein [Planctomycetota bacterium]
MPPIRSPIAALTALTAAAVSAPAAAEPDPYADLVAARALLETDGIAPGETAWVGVLLEIKEGWHTYWPGQNDSGLGTQIVPTMPPGFLIGDPIWPAPERYLAPGDILDHVHTGAVMALVPVKAAPDAEVGSRAEFSFDLSWLVCDDVCIPGWETVTLTVPVVERSDVIGGQVARAFERSRDRIPRQLPEAGHVLVDWLGTAAEIRAGDAKNLSFYPDEGGSTVRDLPVSGTTSSGVLRLSFDAPEPVLSGVLEIHGSGDTSQLFVVRSVRDGED